MMKHLKTLALGCLLAGFGIFAAPMPTQATHLSGGYFYWDYLYDSPQGNPVYRIYCVRYEDCKGGASGGTIPQPPNIQIAGVPTNPFFPNCSQGSGSVVPFNNSAWRNLPIQDPVTGLFYQTDTLTSINGNAPFPGPVNLGRSQEVQDIIPYCNDGQLTTCDLQPGATGVRDGLSKFTWFRDYEFLSTVCPRINFRWSSCCRPSPVYQEQQCNNLTSTFNNGPQCFYASMFQPQLRNNSVRITKDPRPFLYNNRPYSESLNIQDPDGSDVFVTTLVTALDDAPTTNATCNAVPLSWYCPSYATTNDPLTPQNPIPTLAAGGNFTPTTMTNNGQFSFTPGIRDAAFPTGIADVESWSFAVCVRINEFRNGVEVSDIYIDIIYKVYDELSGALNPNQIPPFEYTEPTIDSVYVERTGGPQSNSGTRLAVYSRDINQIGQPVPNFPTDTIQPIPLQGIVVDAQVGDDIEIDFFADDPDVNRFFATDANGNQITDPSGAPIVVERSDSILVEFVGVPTGAQANAPTFFRVPNPFVASDFRWTPTLPGTYQFTVKCLDTNCPLALSSDLIVTINVCETPPAILPNISVNCNEATITIPPQFSSGTFGTYQWLLTGEGGLSENPNNSGSASFTHSFPDTGDFAYEFVVEEGNVFGEGCRIALSDTINISEGVIMLQGAGGDAAVCSDVNALVGTDPSQTGANQSYTWTSNPPGLNFSATNIPNPIASASNTSAAAQSYQAIVNVTESVSGCTFEDSVTVDIFPAPIAQVNASIPLDATLTGEICEGEDVSIRAFQQGGTAAASFFWSNGAPETANQVVLNDITENTSLLVQVANEGNCFSQPLTVKINVVDVPEAAITGDVEVCANESARLSGLGADNYQWAVNGDTTAGQTILIDAQNLPGSGTYTFSARPLENGCPGEFQDFDILVREAPQPAFTISPADGEICRNDFIEFTYTGDANIDEIMWDFGQGTIPGTSTELNPRVQYVAHNLDIPNRPVSVRVIANGCDAEYTEQDANVDIYVNPTPIANFTIEDDAICLNELSISPYRQDFTLKNTTNNDGVPSEVRYQWLLDGNPISNANELPLQNFQVDGTYNYTLIASAVGNECATSATKRVTVLPLPDTAEIVPDTVCAGYRAQFTILGPDNLDFYWYTNPSNNIADREQELFQGVNYVTPDRLYAPRTFYIRTRNAQGCFSDLKQDFPGIVNQQPEIDFEAGQTEMSLPNAITNFRTVGEGVDAVAFYAWDFGDGFSSDLSDPVHQYDNTGRYNVSLAVTDTNDCYFSLIKEEYIEVKDLVFVQLPNAVNLSNPDQSARLVQVYTKLIDEFTLRVYARNGEKLWETNQFGATWDPADLPEGTYVWTVEGTDYFGEEYTDSGTITLFR